jgi:hypothetical protein
MKRERVVGGIATRPIRKLVEHTASLTICSLMDHLIKSTVI